MWARFEIFGKFRLEDGDRRERRGRNNVLALRFFARTRGMLWIGLTSIAVLGSGIIRNFCLFFVHVQIGLHFEFGERGAFSISLKGSGLQF